jgi:predicted DNA-binding antitoxin AbrB/MazE fold protein
MRTFAMSHVEAIFRRGVFEPLGPVDLQEEQRVQLSIETSEKKTLTAWLEGVRELREGVMKRRGGPLPDSSVDIAADRMR